MQPGSGGVPTRQRGFPKCPAVLGWVAAGQNGFLQFAEEPSNFILENISIPAIPLNMDMERITPGGRSNVDAKTITTLAIISAVISQSKRRLDMECPSSGCNIS